MPASPLPCSLTPPNSNSHLDTLETPVGDKTGSIFPDYIPDSLDLRDGFRHSGWTWRRQKVLDALKRTQASYERTRAFCTCGAYFWILRHKKDLERFKTVPDHCHDRFCVPCAAARRATIRDNLAKHLLDQPYRLLTLTVRSNAQPLADLLDHLYRSFRRLRQKTLWKERVRGGVAFLEITYNARTGGWHPHLHCILEGLYIPRPALSELWLHCTRDSCNLDLKLIRSTRGVLAYVMGDATKPIPTSVHSIPYVLDEAITTLAGRRLIVCFGRWRAWKLLADDTEKDWELYAHQNDLHTRFQPDDLLAINVAAMLSTADPVTGEFFVLTDADPPLE